MQPVMRRAGRWLILGPVLAVLIVLALLAGIQIGRCRPGSAACAPVAAVNGLAGRVAPATFTPATGVAPVVRPGDATGQAPAPRSYLPTLTRSIPAPQGPVTYTYQVVNIYPHDIGAFTEGLLWNSGSLYESTGLDGRSDVRRVDLATGQVLQSRLLDPQFFGEGIAIAGDSLYELTWRSRVGFVLDQATFALLSQFSYPTEGWGLTYDGQRLIMSDGSATLHFLDPQTLAQTGQITVTDRGLPVTNLNELECIQGQIFANVWHADRIAIIAPQSGQVTAWLDLTGLRPSQTLTDPEAVLNGIAYDPAAQRLFVTGKMWPYLFEIRPVPLR